MTSGANRARRAAVYVLALMAVIGLAGVALHSVLPESRHVVRRVLDHVQTNDGSDHSDDQSDSHSDGSDNSDGQSGSSGTPPLFPAEQAASVDHIVDPQSSAAGRLMTGWFSAHGTRPDDEAFVHWLESHLPAPPPPQQRRAELAPLRTLAAERSESGQKAAKWIDANGDGSAWPALAQRTAPHQRAIEDGHLRDVLKMADNVSSDLKDKLGQSSPYVLDPALRPGKDVKRDGACPCSYPSSHAAVSAAAATYLVNVDHAHTQVYEGFRNQVDFSRMYMAGHVASDLAAGSLLGDAIAEYFLITREGFSAAQIST